MYAKHPELAEEFEAATPKGKKLPDHVKKAFEVGVTDALARFKLAGFGRNLAVNPKSDELDRAFQAYKNETGRSQNEMSHDDIADYVLRGRTENPAHEEQASGVPWKFIRNMALGTAAGGLAGYGLGKGIGALMNRNGGSGIPSEMVEAALARMKRGSEEIRLQIPRRTFHGFDAAFKNAPRGEKKADEVASAPPLEPQADENSPVERLTAMLQQIDAPGEQRADATKDPLDRNVAWGPPSNLAGGDTAGRLSDMGQPTGIGAV